VKYLPLLFANLKRKKVRTLLTVGSFAVALFLFGLLAAVGAGFRQGIDIAGADRLVVIGRTGVIQPLPLPYMERIRRLPGVKDIAHSTWFGGVYQDPKNFFSQFVVEPESWRGMYPEFKVPDDQWRDFVADRQGVVVGAKLAQRFGWKIGDHLPLKSPGYLGGGSWDFNVRAIYHGTRPQDDEGQLWLQHKYFYEKAPRYWQGIVGWYVVRVSDPDAALGVARAIDQEFANSTSETRTQTESAFAASFMKQMGNIEFLIMAIGSVVFFTLLLVTGNTMAIAVRERTGELAVLKAVGYSDRFVLGLVLAESMLIAAVGGAIGLWLARGMTSQDITSGILPMYLSGAALATGALVALGTGLLAGLLPAVSAMRLSVVDALRRI
jgi:putative ABC transport system permease protein